MDAGADVNVRDEWGCTPLHWTAYQGDAAIVPLLINAGADLNARDDVQRTPIQLAAAQRHIAIVEMLDNAALEDAAKSHARRVGNRRSPGDGKEASR
jgi:ankyrin repeat protein